VNQHVNIPKVTGESSIISAEIDRELCDGGCAIVMVGRR